MSYSKTKSPKHIKRQLYSIQKKCQIYEKLGILGFRKLRAHLKKQGKSREN